MKPKHELSEIVQLYGKSFLRQFAQTKQKLKTLDAIARCRTASLGGHKSKCNACGSEKYFYNSCRNRHCPKCQAVNREKWILQRESELLPVAYYHIVFTLPHELNVLAKKYPKEVYNALFYAGWNTIKTLANDPKYIGAKTGMVAILHTWGQKLWLHPHLHCIVPGGGLTKQGKWKNTKYKDKYLFPQKVMSTIYRAKFVSKLRADGVKIPQEIAKPIFRKDWIVYAKRPFSTPKTVIEYLGRYTHKVAISNHRLNTIENGIINFQYKDYRKGAKKLTTELSASEFLRRFCQHILPKGFVRMRHYGILASRNKATELNIAKSELGMEAWTKSEVDWKTIAREKLNLNPDLCAKCKVGILEIIEGIMPQRGPPTFRLKPQLNFNKQ
ncbi:MAG: IS91 family transposase [Crocinitomix sp.]|nr:IS91 family transposase [Crocinitomix sp.]